jgi:hypothetical protein
MPTRKPIIPPPKGHRERNLREQLRGRTWALVGAFAVVNLIIGVWLWRVGHARRVGHRLTICLGSTGLVLTDVVALGLMLYARGR